MNWFIMIESSLLAIKSPIMAIMGERSSPKPPIRSGGIRSRIGERIGIATARTVSYIACMTVLDGYPGNQENKIFAMMNPNKI